MSKKFFLFFFFQILIFLTACVENPISETQQSVINEPAEVQVEVQSTPSEMPKVDVPAVGGTITRAISSEPATLDPSGAASSGQNVILPYLLDMLIYRDVDNSYKPYLAEKWTISEDGRVVTFFLRDGVKFHDGTPLNAEAVRFTYQRVMQEGSKSPLVSSFSNIEAIEAVGENQVVFRLKKPSATLFSTLSTAYAGIISPTAAEKYGDSFGIHLVGSGPFQLESWKPGESITLVRNEAYSWGPSILSNSGAPYLERIIFQVIPDMSSQLAAFQSGEVDILFINQPAHLDVLRKDPAAQVVEVELNSLVYLGFNVQAEPFGDQRLRRAIAQMIDKKELVEIALGGVGKPAFSPLASTLPGYDASLRDESPDYNLVEAEKLLNEAGYEKRADGKWVDKMNGKELSLEILASTRPPNETLATVIQNQLQRAGVNVTIKLLESKAASEVATQGDYQVMLWRYDWNDADVLNVYLSSSRIGTTNRSFYSNPELDEILESAAVELNEEKRNQLYSQAQRILIQEQPWIPLYVPKDYLVLRSNLSDYIMGPMGRLVLTDAWLKP
ncbi:MAG: ABC transporter substrate-binding protein [Chloroflexota bacterium]